MKKEAKIYQMNECDWWIDYSGNEAVQNFNKLTSNEFSQNEYNLDGYPAEITEKDLDRLIFKPDPYDEPNAPTRTFREELVRRIQENTIPGFFATTEY